MGCGNGISQSLRYVAVHYVAPQLHRVRFWAATGVYVFLEVLGFRDARPRGLLLTKLDIGVQFWPNRATSGHIRAERLNAFLGLDRVQIPSGTLTSHQQARFHRQRLTAAVLPMTVSQARSTMTYHTASRARSKRQSQIGARNYSRRQCRQARHPDHH